MRLGFIGCGNMGKAILRGTLDKKLFSANDIVISARTEETLNNLKKDYDVNTTLDNTSVATKSEILIIGVKPNQYPAVLNEIKYVLNENTIVVSIAAGIDLKFMENILGDNIKIVRTMPNTPVSVLEGVTAVCFNQSVNKNDISKIFEIFNSIGICEIVDESLMDSIPALSGSSPAYVFMFIKAIAEGAIKQGISNDIAYKFAAQSVLGATKMVLETKISPDELKDNVCSPGGTTIEAVKTLERLNFQEIVMEAMDNCTKRAKELSQN